MNNNKKMLKKELKKYQKEYKLYLEYEVLPMDHLGKHDVIVSFVIKRS